MILNRVHKHSKKKCNEKDKWSVTVGTSCGNEKELFCCATSDGSALTHDKEINDKTLPGFVLCESFKETWT